MKPSLGRLPAFLGAIAMMAAPLFAADLAEMTAGPAPKAKPWEAGWGFWPKVPQAWQQTHQGLLNKTKKGGVNVFFFGDSITNGWSGAGKAVWAEKFEPLGASNYGIGGDTTRQLLWRMENGEMDGLTPKVVVLMIGVNNIFTNNGTNEEIAKGVEEVIKQIHAKSPNSKILLLSILPLKAEPFNKRVQEVNPMIAKFAGDKVTYLDLTDKFRGADGQILTDLYVADGTHLAAKGYETWAAAMLPTLEGLAK